MGVKIKKNVSLADYTTFRVGGPTDYFASPGDVNELKDTITWALKEGIPFFLLGRGSNVLVSDRGYRGLVIYTGKLNRIRIDRNHIRAECGLTVNELVNAAVKGGLTGLEFLAGLPGTVGGAVYMNARAYGGEMGDVVEEVTVLKPAKGIGAMEITKLKRDKISFSYKKTIFQEENLYIYDVLIVLKRGNREEIRKKADEIRYKRIERGEYRFPSAGCIFKNDYKIGKPAGKIIDECGLKGLKIGDAAVYERHANFIVNLGNARADDILNLIKLVEERVKEKTGINLKREIILLGFEN